jgi:hypothetical protein
MRKGLLALSAGLAVGLWAYGQSHRGTDSPIWQDMQRYGGMALDLVGDPDWQVDPADYVRPPWRD